MRLLSLKSFVMYILGCRPRARGRGWILVVVVSLSGLKSTWSWRELNTSSAFKALRRSLERTIGVLCL